jgi:acetyl-CoA synthetase
MSAIESVLVENRVFPPSEAIVKAARISGMDAYDACAQKQKRLRRLLGPPGARNLVWTKPFTRTLDESNAPFYKWFDDGELNASANCLDKHIGTPARTRPPSSLKPMTARRHQGDLQGTAGPREPVCQCASRPQGVQKGDRVIIYMPMTVEGVVAMQACARIGATHSVVFGGFSAKALQERIIDAGAVAVITANYQMRGGKELPLKAIVDEGLAMGGCDTLKTVLVYMRTANGLQHGGWPRQDF